MIKSINSVVNTTSMLSITDVVHWFPIIESYFKIDLITLLNNCSDRGFLNPN